MSRTRRFLVPRPADAANPNAQAKNAQQILARWSSRKWRPAILAFGEPDPAVAANPLVDIIEIKPDRAWTARLAAIYQDSFAAVFSPGVHHTADWLAMQVRRLTGRALPVIDTVEGLLAPVGDDRREQAYANAAGHLVFCQKIGRAHFRRVDSVTRRAAHIIAISPFLGRMARQVYGDKVSVLPLGVDTSRFRPALRPAGPRLRIVGAGGVAAHKRPELFLTMAERFAGADFVWCGEGPERARLAAEASRRGLSNLTFPGPMDVSVLAQEFGASDIFVLPSRSEGVPKVTQEAAACGLAQIIFGFYEAPTVVDGANGFVIWSDDELLCRLQLMLGDRELTAKMGRVGKEMSADWSWDSIAPRWERRICEVLDATLDG